MPMYYVYAMVYCCTIADNIMRFSIYEVIKVFHRIPKKLDQ